MDGLPASRAPGWAKRVVDRTQHAVASGVARSDLPRVPLWTLQLLLYLATERAAAKSREAGRFLDFASRSSEAGSRLFQVIWPVDDGALAFCAALSETAGQADLFELLSVALDYGRTIVWSRNRQGPVPSRDLLHAKAQGVFYTPPYVADHLARIALASWSSDKPPSICDPAVGSGSFLVAAARRLRGTYEPGAILDSLHGVDTDPIALELASILVAAACGLWRPGERPPTLGGQFVLGDAFGGPVIGGPPGLEGAVEWGKVYPEIFDATNPGFDVVLVNPPFGRFKVDSDWLVAKEMRLDPASLVRIRSIARKRSTDLRAGSLYPLSSRGVLDKSRIGLERSMQLTRLGGRLGALVPATIAGDSHAEALRKHLLGSWKLEELDEFPEGARLFYGVSQSTCALIATKGELTKRIAIRSSVTAPAGLLAKPTMWDVALVRRLSDKAALPLRGGSPRLLAKLLNHPRLGDLAGVTNARGEIDVTIYSEALTDDAAMTPLVRGEQIDRFRADLPSQKELFVRTDILGARLAGSPKRHHMTRPRLAGRQCSYLYQERRLSFALVAGGHALANSCNYLQTEDEELQLFLLALLNSSVLDWHFKLTNSNNHVANSELANLPIPDLRTVRTAERQHLTKLARTATESGVNAVATELDEATARLYGLNQKETDLLLAGVGGRA